MSDHTTRHEGTIDTTDLRQRIDALGPWFHNIDLKGVPTAPEHFLGNYPAVKWRRFSTAIPSDLTGATVLDVGAWVGQNTVADDRPDGLHLSGDALRRHAEWLVPQVVTVAGQA